MKRLLSLVLALTILMSNVGIAANAQDNESPASAVQQTEVLPEQAAPSSAEDDASADDNEALNDLEENVAGEPEDASEEAIEPSEEASEEATEETAEEAQQPAEEAQQSAVVETEDEEASTLAAYSAKNITVKPVYAECYVGQKVAAIQGPLPGCSFLGPQWAYISLDSKPAGASLEYRLAYVTGNQAAYEVTPDTVGTYKFTVSVGTKEDRKCMSQAYVDYKYVLTVKPLPNTTEEANLTLNLDGKASEEIVGCGAYGGANLKNYQLVSASSSNEAVAAVSGVTVQNDGVHYTVNAVSKGTADVTVTYTGEFTVTNALGNTTMASSMQANPPLRSRANPLVRAISSLAGILLFLRP